MNQTDHRNDPLNKISFILLCLFPISFLSTGVLNLMLIIFSFLSLIFIIKNNTKYILKDKYFLVIGLFFLYLIFQSLFVEYDQSTIKSLFYLKFFFLIIFLSLIAKFQKFNISSVSKISLIFSLFLTFDIYLQFFTGSDIFNLPGEMGGELKSGKIINATRFAGFFGSELIAGSFLTSLGFAYLSLYYHDKKFSKLNILFFFIILTLISLAVIMTGDRSPFISILFIIFFNIALNKGARLYFLIYSFIISIFLFLFIIHNPASYHRYFSEMKRYFNFNNISFDTSIVVTNSEIYDYKNLLKKLSQDSISDNSIEDVKSKLDLLIKKKEANNIKDEQYLEFQNYRDLINKKQIDRLTSKLEEKLKLFENDLNVFLKFKDKFNRIASEENLLLKYYKYYENSPWGQHHSAALDIFRDNKILGTGVRSYRYVCQEYDKDNLYLSHSRCSTHPHNLHFELLSEVGLIGHIIFLILVIGLFIKIFSKNNSKKLFHNFSFIFLLSILISFLVPFKPTGAIFSSWFGASFWFVFSSTYYLYLKK